MPTTQALGRQLVMINGFLIDVSLSEEHTFESEVTEYPVEKGADITDNIRPKPIQVVMEGLVSNTPINPDIIAARKSVDESVDDAYAVLTKIYDDREPVDIRTSLRTYTSMAMKNLVIPRNKSSGGSEALRFTATFIQVQIVSNTRTTRVSTPIAKKEKDVSAGAPPQATASDDLVKVIRTHPFAGNFGGLYAGYFWYDDDIAGWRAKAYTPSERFLIEKHETTTASAILGPYYKADLGDVWAVSKGKPFGASDADWAANPSDLYWRERILTTFNIEGSSSSSGSTYDPFNQLGVGVPTMIKVKAVRR